MIPIEVSQRYVVYQSFYQAIATAITECSDNKKNKGKMEKHMIIASMAFWGILSTYM